MICGVLLAVVAIGVLIFLPDQMANYAVEPEDVELSVFWVAFNVAIAALCFANWARPALRRPFGWRFYANAAAVLVAAGLLFVGRHDPAVLPLMAPALLGPVLALLGLAKALKQETLFAGFPPARE